MSTDDESRVPDPWNLTMLELNEEGARHHSCKTPEGDRTVSIDTDSNPGSPCVAGHSSPKSDFIHADRDLQSSDAKKVMHSGEAGSASGQQSVPSQENDGVSNGDQQQEQPQRAVSMEKIHRSDSEGLMDEEFVSILCLFDPLWGMSSISVVENDQSLLNPDLIDDYVQNMALTNEDLNLFISVLPNINPAPINLEAKSIIDELERFEWDFTFRYNALLPADLRTKLPAEQKAAAWMMAMGVAAREALRSAEWDAAESKHDIDTIKKKLIESVSTPATKYYAVHSFWDARQEQGETVKQFIHRLEMLAAQAKWEKAVKDENMLMRLARALTSKTLRTWIMGQPETTTLAEIKRHCIATEVLDREDQLLQNMADRRDHAVYANKEEKPQQEQRRADNSGGGRQQVLCSYCGQVHYPGKNPVTKKFNCPASGHVCSYCNRRNHFENVCWKKNGQQPGQSTSESGKVNSEKRDESTLSRLIVFETADANVSTLVQRAGKQDEEKPKKKRKKEKTWAVSESSDSTTDSEQENRIAQKVAKKLEKALAAKTKHRSSTDSTPSGEETHFAAQLSDSSDDGAAAPQARSSFYQAFGRHDGGGGSKAGLRGGAPFKKPDLPVKAATLLKDFRIPKIGAVRPVPKTVMDRKADTKHKSQVRANSIRREVNLRRELLRIASGDFDLLRDKREKSRKRVREVKVKTEGCVVNKLDSTVKSRRKKSWSENVGIEGKSLKMKVDSGSTITILTLRDFFRLGLSESRLQPTSSKIVTYSGNKIVPLGKMRASISLRGKIVLAKILVIEEASTSLLGFPEGQELGLFRVDYEFLAKKLEERIDECISGKDRSEHDVVPKAVLEIPPCKFSVKLELKEGARPRILAPRRLPIAIRTKVKDELDRMTSLGVISPVNEPREWCHQMVVADKPSGDVRVCLDPRLLNKYIRREEFQIPDFDALASELTEAKIYSTIDLLSGFWQFGLDDKSKELLTFATPFGRYQYNRLPFGLSCAPEMFHKRVVETLAGIPGVLVYIDDILIWGATQEEHDERLRLVQERLKMAEFSVNPKKCLFSQTKVKFLGHMIEDGQLSVDPSKVEAIRKLPSPGDRKGLKRILGMLSFIRKFVPDYNTLTYPFRGLLKERSLFLWTETEEAALDKIRNSDAWLKALALFKPGKPLTLMADASSYGLGAVLLQDGRPVYFCSRTLTEAEEKWAQIDKEFLAIVWALERLDLFTYGHQVTVHTDHRPLLGLIDKPMDHCSIRQQRLLGRILRYDVVLEFVPGKDMAVADALSRAPGGHEETVHDQRFMGTDLPGDEVFVSECSTEKSVASEFSYTENSDETKQRILRAAKNCSEYAATIKSWYEGWNPAMAVECGELWSVRDALFESEGLLFFEGRVVIPAALRPKYLRALHAGHVGVKATCQRAKNVWWPGIEKDIKNFVDGCACCQSQGDKQRKEPMCSFEIPSAPGLVVASDHFFLVDKRMYCSLTRFRCGRNSFGFRRHRPCT